MSVWWHTAATSSGNNLFAATEQLVETWHLQMTPSSCVEMT